MSDLVELTIFTFAGLIIVSLISGQVEFVDNKVYAPTLPTQSEPFYEDITA